MNQYACMVVLVTLSKLDETACCVYVQGQLLISLLADRKDDDEFVLQIIITLHTLLDYSATRDATLGTSEACPCSTFDSSCALQTSREYFQIDGVSLASIGNHD